MGAIRFTSGKGFSDLRLVLERQRNRIVSALSFYERPGDGPLIRSEYEPDWAVIEDGLSILRNPEDHPGRSIVPMGRELGIAAFGIQAQAALAEHMRKDNVRLWLQASSDLARLPWEACAFAEGSPIFSGVLSLHPGISIIRDLGTRSNSKWGNSPRPRVLVAWADPDSTEFQALPGREREVRGIVRALAAPECRRFEIEELPFANPSSLRKTIFGFKPDIVHFVGHACIRPTGGTIVLESGQPHHAIEVHGDEFAKIFAQANVRLAVLSACMTGDAVSGVALEIAKVGVPAIVAMQGPMADATAGMFARAFYGSLCSGETVDDAVLEGRCALSGSLTDWAAPIVMRVPLESPSFDGDVELEVLPAESNRRHNLTYDDRPFIGRQVERLEVRERICVKRQKLVTVTGMGGMGKTRLAKQVAAEALDDFSDGVWMVECDTFDSRAQLVAGVAAALEIGDLGGEPEETVINWLATKKLLVLLDCFERITDHAEFLDAVLKRSSGCQLLVTSRVVLGLSREYEYRLSPMGLKGKAGTQSDGVALFVEAAGHAVNSFEATPKTRSLVAELCKLLEGVPLAIVLAAGRLRHLSLSELLEQVKQHPLETLRRRGGPKDRQADLYRVVANSFLLLGPRECGLLDRLGLFVGGFSAEDAAEVCNWPRIEMTQGLSTLRDHSLVQVQIVDDRTRYKLLDTVREFLDQMPRDEAEVREREACADRHAQRYARIAEEIGTLMNEGMWNEGAAKLWGTIGNLRAATAYCAKNKMFELTRQLASGLVRTYYNVALNQDLVELLRSGGEAAAELLDLRFEAMLLGIEGAYAATNKIEKGWQSAWTLRAEICESLGDWDNCTDALFDLAWEYFLIGDAQNTESHLARAAAVAEQADDANILARCYVVKAQLDLQSGDVKSAQERVAKATSEIDRLPAEKLSILVLQHLVVLYSRLEDLDRAQSFCERFLRAGIRELRYRSVAWGLLRMAEFHEPKGELDLAFKNLMAATRLYAEFPTRQGEKSRALLSQFVKRHEEFSPLVAAHRKTPWLALVKELPYSFETF